jgi:hypothetical protein
MKSTAKEKILVLDNLRSNAATYTLPSTVSITGWKNAFTGVAVNLNSTMYLQPYQYMVLTQ